MRDLKKRSSLSLYSLRTKQDWTPPSTEKNNQDTKTKRIIQIHAVVPPPFPSLLLLFVQNTHLSEVGDGGSSHATSIWTSKQRFPVVKVEQQLLEQLHPAWCKVWHGRGELRDHAFVYLDSRKLIINVTIIIKIINYWATIEKMINTKKIPKW